MVDALKTQENLDNNIIPDENVERAAEAVKTVLDAVTENLKQGRNVNEAIVVNSQGRSGDSHVSEQLQVENQTQTEEGEWIPGLTRSKANGKHKESDLLQNPHDVHLQKAEKDLTKSYSGVKDSAMTFLRQKAKLMWLKGDEN
ncbi:hypothetical protein RIF29_38495 [Crotalaria pallida]|uniref:Uncharacterized protein n=1 Tax=Crotalaria pallida TaxID=3830 RepID=A0AAN9E4U0_CROPI